MGLTASKKERFREEIRKCKYWLFLNDRHKDLTDTMVETKLIQAEMDGRLFDVKNFIGIV